MKQCCACKLSKTVDHFHNDKKSKDGLAYRCKECACARSKRQRSENVIGCKEYRDQYYRENKEKWTISRERWKRENPEKYKESQKKWEMDNAGKKNSYTAKRRSMKKMATPPWLSKDQLSEIREFYVVAKELQWLSEAPLEVDHIIPLQGELVSGLHVPWNLQILPLPDNRSKSNRI